MEQHATTRTYVGETGTQAFDGYAGFRVGQHYTGTPQPEGTVLVTTATGPPSAGITLKPDEWERWFKK